MVNLSTNWDNIRKLLLEAVLSCEGLPSPNRCHMCLEGKVRIRCHDCSKKFFCPSCDQDVHSLLPFHDRDGYVNGFFQAIPPTVTIDESGIKRIVAKLLPVISVPENCPCCNEGGVLEQRPTTGTIIVINEKVKEGHHIMETCSFPRTTTLTAT